MTAARAAAPGLPSPWVIHCDGSAWPNPGRMGLGALLMGPDGTVRHQISEATTFTGCNNEAELRALLRALQWLQGEAAAATTAVQVISDSSVLVEQLAPPAGARTVAPRPMRPGLGMALPSQWITQPRAGMACAAGVAGVRGTGRGGERGVSGKTPRPCP